MITLCGFSVSNYYNKVKLALLEKGIPFTEELQMTGSKDEAVLSCSPLGKVPYMRTEHGALCESQAMLDYIDAAHPANPLMPRDPDAVLLAMHIQGFLNLGYRLRNHR